LRQAGIIASGGGSIQQVAHMGSASVWPSGRPQRSQTGVPMGAGPLQHAAHRPVLSAKHLHSKH